MRVLKWLMIGLLIAMVVCAIVMPETADKGRVIDALGKSIFGLFGLVTLGYMHRFWRWVRRPKTGETPVASRTQNAIVVDGSNVMHWGGDPSLKVLSRVLQELQRRGLHPLVYFDANVGYKLFDRHVKPKELAQELALPLEQITLAPSRTPADEVLLAHAVSDGLRVVTNDRFLDWKQRFPKVGEKGFLIKGMWKEGSVILLGLGRA